MVDWGTLIGEGLLTLGATFGGVLGAFVLERKRERAAERNAAAKRAADFGRTKAALAREIASNLSVAAAMTQDNDHPPFRSWERATAKFSFTTWEAVREQFVASSPSTATIELAARVYAKLRSATNYVTATRIAPAAWQEDKDDDYYAFSIILYDVYEDSIELLELLDASELIDAALREGITDAEPSGDSG